MVILLTQIRSALRRLSMPVAQAALPLAGWGIAALLIAFAGWTLLLRTLDRHEQDLHANTTTQVALLARGYAEQLARTFESIDQIIRHVRHEWNLSSGKLSLEEAQATGLFPPTSLLFVAITDRKGNIVTSTIPDTESVNVQGKPYFALQQQAGEDLLHFWARDNTTTASANTLQFSRRLIDADGDFAGVVLATAAPSYLTASYDAASLGSGGFLGIVGEDRAVKVTRIGSAVHTAQSPALLHVPAFTGPDGYMLADGEYWFSDKRARFVAWQAVRGFPVFALAGLDRDQAFAAYNAYRQSLIRAGFGATLALVLLTLIAMTVSVSLAWRKHQLEWTKAAYRMATEEGNEGFYIARLLPVKDRKIPDFEIVDCNQRGAQFFLLPRNELIGRKISESPLGKGWDQWQKVLSNAVDTGFSEAEVEVPEELRLSSAWLHVNAVFSDGQIAITLRNISVAKAHVAELERRGDEDMLTGLHNGRWIQSYLAEAIRRSQSGGQMLAILYVDLDGFKQVNDTMGHACADELLKNAARRLQTAVRPQDHVVRIGEAEFIVLIEQIGNTDEAAFVAERILLAFGEPFRLSRGTHALSSSIGISVFPHDGQDVQTLLRCADIAMYSVKTAGKRKFRFYDAKFDDALRRRFEREAELLHAIAADEFVMYYQPRLDISTGMMSSMESLIRWRHASRGIVGPAEFVPLADETGLIVELGTLTIDKVCAQIGEWRKTGKPVVPVSINVSPRQFSETDVPALIASALARHNVTPELVEIEVTESSMMEEGGDISNTLGRLQEMGIKLLVDDFGTGYSSLAQLQRMDFDVLKVDRAFTCRIDRSDEGNVFFKAIITMAHALGMRVVAEGVENEQQLVLLRAWGCDEIQGFYFSRPLPASENQPTFPRWRFSSAA